LKANVSLYQISWKTVPQLQTCSCKTPVSIVAVGLSGRSQPADCRRRLPYDGRCISVYQRGCVGERWVAVVSSRVSVIARWLFQWHWHISTSSAWGSGATEHWTGHSPLSQ